MQIFFQYIKILTSAYFLEKMLKLFSNFRLYGWKYPNTRIKSQHTNVWPKYAQENAKRSIWHNSTLRWISVPTYFFWNRYCKVIIQIWSIVDSLLFLLLICRKAGNITLQLQKSQRWLPKICSKVALSKVCS